MKSSIFEEVRIKNGVSQQKVANDMELSLTAYRNKEKGRSKFFIDEIPFFCESVGIDIKEMISKIFLE